MLKLKNKNQILESLIDNLNKIFDTKEFEENIKNKTGNFDPNKNQLKTFIFNKRRKELLYKYKLLNKYEKGAK